MLSKASIFIGILSVLNLNVLLPSVVAPTGGLIQGKRNQINGYSFDTELSI